MPVGNTTIGGGVQPRVPSAVATPAVQGAAPLMQPSLAQRQMGQPGRGSYRQATVSVVSGEPEAWTTVDLW